jgi:hypothetical protein
VNYTTEREKKTEDEGVAVNREGENNQNQKGRKLGFAQRVLHK